MGAAWSRQTGRRESDLFSAQHGAIYLLYAYAKNEQPDLTSDQRKLLAQWVQEVLTDE